MSARRFAAHAALTAVCTLTLSCAGAFRLRVDEPSGATLIVRGGPFRDEVRAPVPFAAEFDPHVNVPYPVRVEMPADVAQRYGGAGLVRLYGYLYVYPPSELLRPGTTVRLQFSDARLRELVTGQSTEMCEYVQDATRAAASSGRSLSGCPSIGSGARIVLRTTPF